VRQTLTIQDAFLSLLAYALYSVDSRGCGASGKACILSVVLLSSDSTQGEHLGTAAGKNPFTEDLKVLLLDRAPLPEVSTPLGEAPELRVSTLTPASVRLFRESGAWDDMAPPRSAPFQHMQVLQHSRLPWGRHIP